MSVPPAMSVTRAERRWVWGLALFAAVLTSLPYVLGYALQGEAYRFSGFVFGVEDGHSYIAKMLIGASGGWLFRSPYTAEVQRGIGLFMLHIWLGKLAAVPALHTQLVALFHLLRVGSILLLAHALYDFVAFFIQRIVWRRVGLGLALLGGGLGWLALALRPAPAWFTLPLEMYSPEAFGFLHIFGLPHLALGRAFLCWTLLLYLQLAGGWQPLNRRSLLRLAGLWLLIGLGQPLSMATAGAVMALHLLLLRLRRGQAVPWMHQAVPWMRLALGWALAALPAGLYLLYILALSLFDPYMRIWASQNVLPSPHPFSYLLSYSLVLPYALWGGRRLLRRFKDWPGAPAWLPLGWLALLPLLAYAPLAVQRRLPEGVWLAWVVVALAAFDAAPGPAPEDDAAPAAPARPLRALPGWAAAPLALSLVSTLMLLMGSFQWLANPAPPLYVPIQAVRLYEYLQATARPGQVVLASPATSEPLPAFAPLFVLVGHGPESAHQAELLPQVRAFYTAATPEAQRLELLRRYQIAYVVWGPDERALGDWQSHQSPYLRPVFQAGDYQLLEVLPLP